MKEINTISGIIQKVLTDSDLPKEINLQNKNVIRVSEEKKHYAVYFISKLLFRIIDDKSTYFEFRPEYIDLFINLQIIYSPNHWIKVKLEDIQDITHHKDKIVNIIKIELNKVQGEPMGCCSKYVECSNEKRCICNDFELSLSCQYRINLINGRIFYGINKNT